jgi:hypothetical protein
MRSGFWATYVWVVVISVFMMGLPQSLGRPQSTQSPAIVRKYVASFRVERLSLLDALLQLGQQEGVPLGIEYVDRQALEKPISVRMDETTVGEIMERLLGRDKEYSWLVREGVLTVRHASVGPGKENLLDHVIPEFSVARCSVIEASNLLRMDLELELNPQIRGFAGDYSPGDPQNLIGPFKMRNVPVWRVLNRLVSADKKAAWIVQVPQGHLDNLPSYGLWTIVEYEDPPRRYAEVLRKTIWGSNPNPTDRQ